MPILPTVIPTWRVSPSIRLHYYSGVSLPALQFHNSLSPSSIHARRSVMSSGLCGGGVVTCMFAGDILWAQRSAAAGEEAWRRCADERDNEGVFNWDGHE